MNDDARCIRGGVNDWFETRGSDGDDNDEDNDGFNKDLIEDKSSS